MKIAFTPAVYEHAARFVGRTPWDLLHEHLHRGATRFQVLPNAESHHAPSDR